MNSFLRSPLVCAAALASYVTVHVFAGAVHHHQADQRPAPTPTTYIKGLELQTISPAENDYEESCLLCNILHLAQIPAAALHVEAISALNGEALSATALIRRHPLETATYSRGPP